MVRANNKKLYFIVFMVLGFASIFVYFVFNKSSNEKNIVETASSEKWFERWIANPNGQLSYWFGIAPEQTRLEEIQKILTDDTYIDKKSVQTEFLGITKKGFVKWKWKGGKSGGVIELANLNGIHTASVITPILYEPISSTQIVETFGEPNYVLIKPTSNPTKVARFDYTLTLVYSSKGFVLFSYGVNNISESVLSSDIEFTSMHFFSPTTVDLNLVVSDAGLLIPWQGNQSYLYYCQQLEATRTLC